MQICGEALESAYWLQIAVRSDGNVMRFVAHIDPRSAGMDYLQPGILRSQPPRELLPLLAIPPQLLVYRHLGSPWWDMETRFGPVTNGLEISPTGSKDRYIQVLATMPVIASTGAMLSTGHKAPVRLRP